MENCKVERDPSRVGPPAVTPTHEIRLARTADELRGAYRLLHDEYVRLGYQDPVPSGIRLLPHYTLPTTHTLVALNESQVAASVTVILPGRLGMPLESIYPDFACGRRPAEVSGLVALAPDRALIPRLLATLYAHARFVLDVTDFLITVNPAHEAFYKKMLLFESFGPVRPGDKVKGAPAVLLRLDLCTWEERYFAVHGSGSGMSRHLVSRRFTPEGIDYPRMAEGLKMDLVDSVGARLELVVREVSRPC